MSRTIVVTGGGSGGHITPILAVSAAIKQLDPQAKIIYVGQTGDKLADIPAKDPIIDQIFTVRAGKYRRYHGEGLKQLLDFKTIGLNIRDFCYVFIGIIQSWKLMRKIKPDVIFTRGGFVSVPVALGGKLNSVPYITHDSDSTPSMANRIIARWAALHAVALPVNIYPYPESKTVTVGVPISAEYTKMTPEIEHKYKHELNLPQHSKILLVTGGGNGASQLNQVVISSSKYLLDRYKDLYIVHFAGRALEKAVLQAYSSTLETAASKRVIVKGYAEDHHKYSGVADVIIARGGATSLAELAAQAKAVIVVPSKQLIWNIKNTEVLYNMGAIVKLTEVQSEQERRLALAVCDLLDDDTKRNQLAQELHKLARPDSAQELAKLVLQQTKNEVTV